MSILDKIVKHKKQELIQAKSSISEAELLIQIDQQVPTISLKENLLHEESSNIIAEFKRKSPSKGWIHQDALVEEVAKKYQSAGAAAMSVLTDGHFFGGSHQDIFSARQVFNQAILRKDFIIDPYQILESRAMGADVILLIAAILTPQQIIDFTRIAHELGLEVLLEVHHQRELEHYHESVDLVGINNRDLNDFSVSLLTSIDLKRRLPQNATKISESGLEHPGIVYDLFKYGFRGFLMGEHFMKHENPGAACSAFVDSFQLLKQYPIQQDRA